MTLKSLVTRRQEDLQGGHPDYHVYAGEKLVGRIYRTHLPTTDCWFWGVNAITYDITLRIPMSGNASGLADAKAKLRAAFDRWPVWALAIPVTDKKYAAVRREMKAMGL